VKRILLYGVAIAVGASLLTWIRYRHVVRLIPTELYIGAIAVAFTGLGAWVGYRVTRPRVAPDGARNDKAIAALRISPRELDVLALLAEGLSNKEMAARLFVSPNTIKTHLKHLYEKLEVSRRTQAIAKARELRLIT
jgi:DNA-binding CsgD family transcriptional regulator